MDALNNKIIKQINSEHDDAQYGATSTQEENIFHLAAVFSQNS